jgi:sulfate permease, SulP family
VTAGGARTPPAATLLRDMAGGLLVGTLKVIVALSLAALVFGDDLGDLRARGIGLALLSTIAVGTLAALLGSLPGTAGSVQDTPAAVLAVMAAAVATALPAGSDVETRFMTVVALVGLTTIATGTSFLLVGVFRLGRLVRYLPYPVVGGFMAGTGWLLLTGGIGVMSGVQPSVGYLADLLAHGVWIRWLPGLGLAVALVLATRLSSHPLVFPGITVAAAAAFYLTMAASSGSVEAWRSGGLLLGPFPEGAPFRPVGVGDFGHVRWDVVAAHAAGGATVAFLSLLALLFNATGLELALGRKLDLDRELRVAGLGNLLAGSLGGMIGYHVLSFTLLNHRLGSGSRLVALVSLAVVGAALAIGPAPLAFVPTLVVGGVLAYLGLSLLIEWLYGAATRLSRVEYGIVVVILATIAAVGFLPGIALGLGLAVVLFVVSYSRVDVVRHELSGAEARSRVRWSEHEGRTLDERGGSILVFQLQGFLFFGSVAGLVQRVERRLASGPLEHLILDFRHVSGADATAAASFARLVRLGSARGFAVHLTEASTALAQRLARAAPRALADDRITRFATLDDALEWCERATLASAGSSRGARSEPQSAAGTPEPAAATPEPAAEMPAPLAPAAPDELDPRALLAHLERLEVPAGHRLMTQGEPSDDLYLIERGRVTAWLEREGGPRVRLETMQGGTLVGEVAFFTGAPRTASVVTDTPATLHRLTREGLDALAEREPEAAAALQRLIVTRLADRVQHLQRVLAALQR